MPLQQRTWFHRPTSSGRALSARPTLFEKDDTMKYFTMIVDSMIKFMIFSMSLT